MFRNDRNTKKRLKIDKQFKKFKDEHFEKQDYEFFQKQYLEIKLQYINKIEYNNLDIKVERARIEDLSNKNLGLSSNIMINIAIIAVSFFITNVYELLMNSLSINNFASKLFYVFLFYFSMCISINKSFSGDTKKEKFYNLCLRVLDDIENEMQEDKKIEDVQNENIQKLIAVTLQRRQRKNVSFTKNFFRKMINYQK